MALLSAKKIEELFGKPIQLTDVSGSVDGTSHMDLIPEVVNLSNVPYPAGNFICRQGIRKIRGEERNVQTIGWLTPSGRLLNLGSLYKKNSLGAMNSKNIGVPAGSNRADLLPLLFGKNCTIGAREEIMVPTFRPGPGEETEVKGSWYTFTIQ